MPLPDALSTLLLKCGPYYDQDGDPVRGLVGVLTLPEQIVELASGAVILRREKRIVTGADGRATVELLHNDQSGISPINFAYTLRWQEQHGVDMPKNWTFPTPTVIGGEVDYDLMIPLSSVPTIAVPIAVPIDLVEQVAASAASAAAAAVQAAAEALAAQGGLAAAVAQAAEASSAAASAEELAASSSAYAAASQDAATTSAASAASAVAAVQGLAQVVGSKASPADITAAVNALINSAPGALDTLGELAAALAADQSAVSALTAAIAAKAADGAVVHLAGSETIAGTKTFSSSPIVPTPTAAGHASPRSYVDTAVANLVGAAPGTLDTLQEIAAQLAADESAVGAISTTLGTKVTAAQVATDLANPASTIGVAGRAALVSPLPTVGTYTYNTDGTIATDPDGNAYTWNTDGTPKTQTKGGVTRNYTWATDGTLTSVS